jgi:hypothetical protein
MQTAMHEIPLVQKLERLGHRFCQIEDRFPGKPRALFKLTCERFTFDQLVGQICVGLLETATVVPQGRTGAASCWSTGFSLKNAR